MHQLGLGGGEKKTAIPKRVAALYGKPVVSVSCGSSHTAWYVSVSVSTQFRQSGLLLTFACWPVSRRWVASTRGAPVPQVCWGTAKRLIRSRLALLKSCAVCSSHAIQLALVLS